MPTVLFVCTANVCRSPLAEVVFRDWLRRHAVPGEWHVASAGTWGREGAPATAGLDRRLQVLGLDLAGHRARRVTVELLAASDLTVCMTRSHCEALRVEFPGLAPRIKLLSEMVGRVYDVPDPGDVLEPDYTGLVSEITQLIEQGGARIVALAQAGA